MSHYRLSEVANKSNFIADEKAMPQHASTDQDQS